ncbi:MAG: 5-formyltetrahydrofolate cyclo-ligase [Halioglobus sp.]
MSYDHTDNGAFGSHEDVAHRKATLRSELRQRRRALSADEQLGAARAVATAITQLPSWSGANKIATYFAADGELDPSELMALARRDHKQVFLPVITPQSTLVFHRWDPDATLTTNRYGIPEPLDGDVVQAGELGYIFMPVVGWDPAGGRLGMGGGYYDRSLQSLSGPTLVGLAHDCQRLDSIPLERWDIRLDYVATASGLHACRTTP